MLDGSRVIMLQPAGVRLLATASQTFESLCADIAESLTAAQTGQLAAMLQTIAISPALRAS